MILNWIAEGVSIREVCRKLGFGNKGITALYSWRNEKPERRAAWAEALRRRGDYLAEECLEIADEVPQEQEAIRKADLRIKTRQWVAACSNPEAYGKSQPQVTVNIEALHLTAVKNLNDRMEEQAKARLAAGAEGSTEDEADYEIMTEADAG